MLKAILIDDEPKNIKILNKLITEFCPEIEIKGEATNSKGGIDLIRKLSPDLVFLDIEMPYGNAFDMIDELKPIDFEIIFVTAFDDYTLRAFKYAALDYLLKPVNIEELQMAVKKAANKINVKTLNKQIDYLVKNLSKRSFTPTKIALPSKEGLIFIPIADILRCEANGGYTFIYTLQKEKIVSTKNIKEYDELLPNDIFFRVHNSHLINLNFIKKYHRGRGGYVEMDDGKTIEVASRRKEDFLSRFSRKKNMH